MDIMVIEDDIEHVKEILSDMGNIQLYIPDEKYKTKVFLEYVIDGIDVDVMAGFAIKHNEVIYDCSLTKDQIIEYIDYQGEQIPLQSVNLWCRYYELMGRDKKVKMIKDYIGGKNMHLTQFYKSVLDEDKSAIVICDLNDIIVYMNPTAADRYRSRGVKVGDCILDCHNENSVMMIHKIVDWFKAKSSHNRIYMYHHDKDNKDVYMIALRDNQGQLIGYYEKHEHRNQEEGKSYWFYD